MLLDLINSLELDQTIVFQFGIFLVGFLFLYYALFKPYNDAAEERYQKTVGSEESAYKYDEEIELLRRKYGNKVKETNLAVKEVFQDTETKAKKEINELLISAQEKYRTEKEKQEEEIRKSFQVEKEKVPSLVSELKDTFKKVLLGA